MTVFGDEALISYPHPINQKTTAFIYIEWNNNYWIQASESRKGRYIYKKILKIEKIVIVL